MRPETVPGRMSASTPIQRLHRLLARSARAQPATGARTDRLLVGLGAATYEVLYPDTGPQGGDRAGSAEVWRDLATGQEFDLENLFTEGDQP